MILKSTDRLRGLNDCRSHGHHFSDPILCEDICDRRKKLAPDLHQQLSETSYHWCYCTCGRRA